MNFNQYKPQQPLFGQKIEALSNQHNQNSPLSGMSTGSIKSNQSQQENYRMMQQLYQKQQLARQQQAQQAQQRMIANEERCAKHGEINVGYIQETEKVVCNKCIYEEKLEKIKFIALVSKELNFKFQQAFNEYKQSISKLDQVDPDLVKAKFTQIVKEFFEQLSQRVSQLQGGVMDKIKNSESLKQLEKILDGSKEFFNVQQEGNAQAKQDQFEREKQQFDQKIAKGRFASVVKRQDFYKQLLEALDSNCSKMKQTIDLSSQQIQKVLKLQANEKFINEQLTAIVRDWIDIDIQGSVDADQSNPMAQLAQAQQAELMRQKMAAQQELMRKQQAAQQEIERQRQQAQLQQMQQERMRQAQEAQMRAAQAAQEAARNAQDDHSASANSVNESSEQSNASNSASNSIQSSPNVSKAPAVPIEVDVGPAPQAPTSEKPNPPPQWQMPMQPQNLTDQQKEQFKLYVQLRQQQHMQRIKAYQVQLAQWENEQSTYQKALEEYNAKKAAAQAQQQKAQDECMVVEAPAPQVRDEVQITKVVEQVIDVDQQMKVQEEEEVHVTAPPQIRELSYQTFFKLKSMKLMQLIPSQGWRHIYDVKDLYMAKIAFNPEGSQVFVVGGAKDPKSKITVNNVTLYNISNQGISSQNAASMIDARASFGCLYLPRQHAEIIVTGGYINGKLSTKCERYNVATNTWSPLPDLNEAKASSSLCLMNDRFLYCFGGLSRNTQGQAFLTNSIEVLDLHSHMPRWERLSMNLPITGCDIGCVPVNKDQILVFGGWNKNAQKGVYMFNRRQSMSMQVCHDLQILQTSLEQPDFFLVNGIALKTGDSRRVQIAGHAQLFQFNMETLSFEGCQ